MDTHLEELETEVEEIKKRTKPGVIVKTLRELETEKGMLTPYDVVNAARDEKSPLHNSFDWDDSRAGEKYRLMQARIMLATVKVEFTGEKRQLYYNAVVKVNNIPTRGYFPIEQVMSDEELHKQVLRQAIQEIEHAQKKYNSLREFRGVINTRKLQQAKRQAS